MTGHSDPRAWAVALGLLACLALVGGVIAESWQDEAHRVPAQGTEFFAVALA